jgi:hypothetical protein
MPAQAAAGRQPPEANLFIIRGFRSRVKPDSLPIQDESLMTVPVTREDENALGDHLERN